MNKVSAAIANRANKIAIIPKIKSLSKILLIASSLLATSAMAVLVHPKADRTSGAADAASDQADQRHVLINWDVFKTIISYVEGSVNFKVAQPVTVGVKAGAWFYGGTDDDGDDYGSSGRVWNVAVKMTYAFNHHVMQSGWLVSPYVGYAHSAAGTGLLAADESSSISVGVPFLYQWMWNSGFNMQLGAGPSYSKIKMGQGSFQGAGLTASYSLGFAF